MLTNTLVCLYIKVLFVSLFNNFGSVDSYNNLHTFKLAQSNIELDPKEGE